MNLDNLKIGQVVNNYKILCGLLDWKVSSNNTKKAQLKELERYVEYHKEGNKYIIDEIFEEPKEKQDLRKNNKGNIKEYDQLNVEQSEWNNIGIYYILKDNDIYIGSTIAGFRDRFQHHYYGYDKNMEHTYELLHQGATLNILYDMTGIEDEVLLRQVEDEYIQYFINNTNYNVINKKENAYSLTEKKSKVKKNKPIKKKQNKKIKYKTLKVKIQEDRYEQAMQLLIDNGLLDLEPHDSMIENVKFEFDMNNIQF